MGGTNCHPVTVPSVRHVPCGFICMSDGRNTITNRITIRLDRIGIASWAAPGRKPPLLKGFKLKYDRFIRGSRYVRARGLESVDSDARVGWQYQRRHGWLKHWRIVMNGADATGITPLQLREVLKHCRFWRFVLIEVAFDFPPGLGVDRRFVRRHAVFGKSHRRFDRGGKSNLRYGSRQARKLVRCYAKPSIGAYRVELEFHHQLISENRITTAEDIANVPFDMVPKHFRFVCFRWKALRRYLDGRSDLDAAATVSKAKAEARISLTKALKYLRRKGVVNVHKFLMPMRINQSVTKAITRWSADFMRGLNE